MSRDDQQALAKAAATILKAAEEKGLTLATAESCTAGALAHLLAGAPGASERLHGGFVVYTKANKTAALGVPARLLAEQSAVSADVAKAMAKGALERSPADIAVAITGVAGPEPDEDGNPVGLVHLAAAAKGGLLLHEEHRFGERDKAAICAASMDRALGLVAKAIAESPARK